MKKKLQYYIKEILVSFVMVVLVLNIVSIYRAQDLTTEKFPLENFFLEDKPFMIHFWATWCPVCKLEAPNIKKVSQDYTVLTIAVDSGSDEEISKYLQLHDLDFEVLNDQNYNYARQFNIKVFPTTIIYDKNKNVVFKEVGYTSTLGLYIRMWWAGL